MKSAETSVTELPPLKSPVTSFGAAVADGSLYVFGGHLGSPHEYSAALQANKLLRLQLANPSQWETVSEGPRRTGLAMVAYRSDVYRVGGWEARDAGGGKWTLHSTPDFARYDAKAAKWVELAPLPRGRSSHDAAVLGDHLYVVGGWELDGEGSGDWHDTAYVCDLSASQLQWKEIARPPFNRRALAVAGYAGKLYVLGGMDDSNEATTAVAVYDPQSTAWSEGIAVPGEKADGFGMSAIGSDAGLFASTRTGVIYRLQDNGKQWTTVAKMKHPRYFHRLLVSNEGRLIVVGGTSREGKVAAVESIELGIAGR
jgi:N-acetylneuraminic acid mutarotase